MVWSRCVIIKREWLGKVRRNEDFYKVIHTLHSEFGRCPIIFCFTAVLSSVSFLQLVNDKLSNSPILLQLIFVACFYYTLVFPPDNFGSSFVKFTSKHCIFPNFTFQIFQSWFEKNWQCCKRWINKCFKVIVKKRLQKIQERKMVQSKHTLNFQICNALAFSSVTNIVTRVLTFKVMYDQLGTVAILL